MTKKNEERKQNVKSRGNGDGSIYYSESRKCWIGQATVGKTDKGKPKRKAVYGKTKKEVKDKITKLKNELITGTYIEPNQISVYDFIKSLIDNDLAYNLIKPNTHYTKLNQINIIKQYPIGNTPLCKVTEFQIDEIMRGIAKDYSNSIIKKVSGLLRRGFREATRKRLIPYDIMYGIQTPKAAKKDIDKRALSISEHKEFLKHISDLKFADAYYIMLNTGLRMGEICALRPKDVNITFKMLNVTRTVTGDNKCKPILGTETKTEAGARLIPLSEPVLEIFKRCIENYRPNPENLLFYDHEKNKMLNTPRLNAAFKRLDNKYHFIDEELSKEKGKVSLHSLRHTYATRCIESGMTADVLKALLGHSDIKITLNTYCDAFEEYQRKHINTAEEYLKNNELIG